jgi:hypothetical protein
MTMNAPPGKRLKDGYRTRLGFSLNAAVNIWEKTVQPPGLEAGGLIDTTTMLNDVMRTGSPKALKTATEMTFKCAYDPAVYPQMIAMLGKNQLVYCYLPNGGRIDIWGEVDSFKPPEHEEGTMPLADCVIIPTNEDNDGNEVEPEYTAPTTSATTTTTEGP